VNDWNQLIPHPLGTARASHGRSLALVTDDQQWTYEGLSQAVLRRAAGLVAAGVTPGERVAWTMTRRGEDIVSLHALGWIGACAVPIPAEDPDPKRYADQLGAERFVESFADGSACDAPSARPWPLDEARFVVATSGSTGQPKAVVITTGQLVFSAFGSAMRLGHLPGDRWLAVLPMHHIGGLSILMRCLFAATTVELHARFDAERVAEALSQGLVTQLSLVPTMLDAVLEHLSPSGAHANLRTVLIGGAKPSAELIQRATAYGLPIAVSWGMSETASQAATLPVGEPLGAAPALVGLEVVSEAERLIVRGPAAGGVCVTGDLGQVDALGRVSVSGRADAVIISGGENIDPSEIVKVLCEHPDVARAHVVGIADATYGERPAAALIAAGDRRPSADELRAFCQQRLVAFKAPDRILWLNEEPLNAMGKVRFADLREWLSRVESTGYNGEPR